MIKHNFKSFYVLVSSPWWTESKTSKTITNYLSHTLLANLGFIFQPPKHKVTQKNHQYKSAVVLWPRYWNKHWTQSWVSLLVHWTIGPRQMKLIELFVTWCGDYSCQGEAISNSFGHGDWYRETQKKYQVTAAVCGTLFWCFFCYFYCHNCHWLPLISLYYSHHCCYW